MTAALHQALIATYGGADGGALPALDVLFMAGAEHETTGGVKCKGTAHSTAPASGVAGAHGRVYDNTSFQIGVGNFTATGALTAKFRLRIRTLGDASFCSVRTSSTQHVGLECNSDGTIDVVVQGGITHTSASAVFAIDTWYEIEFQVDIDNTAGTYTLKIDGVVPGKSGGGTLSQTGLDTQNGGTTTANNVLLGNAATMDTYVDDIVIDSAMNEVGLGQIETLYPNGAGDLAEMTRGGSDSGANWSQCDEAVSNDFTDYVTNSASNKRDCYAFQNRSISGTPRALQVVATTTFSSGTVTFKMFVRIGGVNYDGANTHTAPGGFECFTEVWNTNPATSAAWTDADINGAQFGVHAIDANLILTQLVVEVFVAT